MHVYPPVSRFDGSSPHTRGAPVGAGTGVSVFGIIPAYAGSTARPPRSRRRRRGSSPHTRGAPRAARPPGKLHGIIPAYAGSTGDQWGQDRVRVGSSPHTRGARIPCPLLGIESGIIPAYAGSTGRGGRLASCLRDHPRIRGEHPRYKGLFDPEDGSSPHTRGAPAGGDVLYPPAGIIPAYAGSTIPPRSQAMSPADHPRIRGEHENLPSSGAPGFGSSPHTRGAHAR